MRARCSRVLDRSLVPLGDTRLWPAAWPRRDAWETV
jgi:hypothetical protein